MLIISKNYHLISNVIEADYVADSHVKHTLQS